MGNFNCCLCGGDTGVNLGISGTLGSKIEWCSKCDDEVVNYIDTLKNISKNKLLTTKEKKQNKNYTDYVLKTGVQKSNLELFVALSPCIIGYGEIGYTLSKVKNWKKSKYASWIKMYASKEYQNISKENKR